MGYLGEALLRTGGGSWAWNDDPESSSYDLPLVRPDGELEFRQISPLDLIAAAARTRSSIEFVSVHAALERAVADRKAVEPSWNPTKELTPGVDDILDSRPSEFLIGWLAEREAAFPRWIADYAGGSGTWDFSPESLDTLEALVRSTIPSFDDLASRSTRTSPRVRRGTSARSCTWSWADSGATTPVRSIGSTPGGDGRTSSR